MTKYFIVLLWCVNKKKMEKYFVLFQSDYEIYGYSIKEDTFLGQYIDIEDLIVLYEIENEMNEDKYCIKKIIYSNKHFDLKDKIKIGDKIRANDAMGTIGFYNFENQFIGLNPFYFLVCHKSDLLFYSSNMLDNKLQNLKEILSILNKSAMYLKKYENIFLEKMSSAIKTIIFDDVDDDTAVIERLI